MTRPAAITFMTDFGASSPYVAQMKGMVLAIAPGARCVDITHTIAPQDIRHGALVWSDTAKWFPHGTIHVGVVDPGVGTDRRLVAADIDGHSFIGPDNGLLDLVLQRASTVRAVELTEREYFAPEVSATFHGRDVMAPVAAHLANGVPLEALGRAVSLVARLSWELPESRPGEVSGRVIMADSFGNLITNIERCHLSEAGLAPEEAEVSIGARRIVGIQATYGHVPAGSLTALFGSNGRLEIAESMGSAARTLGWSPDHPPLRVTVRTFGHANAPRPQ